MIIHNARERAILDLAELSIQVQHGRIFDECVRLPIYR